MPVTTSAHPSSGVGLPVLETRPVGAHLVSGDVHADPVHVVADPTEIGRLIGAGAGAPQHEAEDPDEHRGGGVVAGVVDEPHEGSAAVAEAVRAPVDVGPAPVALLQQLVLETAILKLKNDGRRKRECPKS